MRKLFLLLTLFAVGFLSAQGNGDFVSFQFVKTTPGEQYNVILNEKWKELHQMRIDEGTITCLLYTSPSPRDLSTSRMPSSA